MSESGTSRTLRDVRLESGMRSKADVRPTPLNLWVHALNTSQEQPGEQRKVQRVEKRLERLEIDNQELQGQVKRAYQQLNVMKVRNDYLEHKLQQYLEQEQSAVLGEEDEDGEELWSSVENGIE